MLHVRRVTRAEEFDCLGPAWNELLRHDDPFAPFLSHEWITAWYAAYGAGRRLHVLLAHQGEALQGILPLLESRQRFAGLPLRCLDFPANGHSPAADLVIRAGAEVAVQQAFTAHLREGDPDWDVATFAEAASNSNLAQMIAGFSSAERHVQPQRSSPYIGLEGDWETYRGSLSKNFQRALRNNRNRIARAGGAVVEACVAAEEVEAAMSDVFAIGDKSWQGSEGSAVGSTAENAAFYRGIVRALAPHGLVRLWFLRLGGRRVAFELHVVHAGVEFGLKTGFDRDFEDLGVGTYLDQHIVQTLFEEKRCREYDLLGNADFYKQRWTDRTRDYARHLLFGASAPGRLASLWNLKLKPVLRQARDTLRSDS